METQTVNVPVWLVDLYHYGQRNWVGAVILLITAVLAITVTEYFKYRKKKKIEIVSASDKAKFSRYIAYVLTASLTFFNVLGQFIWFASNNLSVLQQLPIVGKHVLNGLGVAYLLYNLRLNKYYRLATVKLTKDKTPKTISVEPVQEVQFPN
jgi:hypothetical protein